MRDMRMRLMVTLIYLFKNELYITYKLYNNIHHKVHSLVGFLNNQRSFPLPGHS